MLRNWWVESDAGFDPQAFVLRPDVALNLSEQIVAEPTPYLRTRRAAVATLECLRQATSTGQIPLSKLELRWLDKLSRQADTLPAEEGAFIVQMVPLVDAGKVRLSEYSL